MGATASDTAVTRRLLTPDDALAAFDLVAAADLAAVGFVDVTRDEVAAYLRSDDAEVHGWWDGQRLVGYGYASRTEQSNQVELPYALGSSGRSITR
jgi:hypothetical protein